MSLFTYQPRILTAEATNKPKDYLPKELGIVVKSLQDENTMIAIQDPHKFLKKREGIIKGMFDENIAEDKAYGIPKGDGRVTKFYEARIKELNELGMSSDKAHSIAVESARRFFEEELQILEYSMPSAYKQAFSTVAVDHNAKVEKEEIARERDEFDKKAYKKKLKQKYKQKYSK